MGSSTVVVAGIVASIGLLLCSAFFSSTETAIFSLPRAWIDEQAATDDPRARLLQELHDDRHRLLVTLLVGNNVVNLAIASITTVIVSSFLAPGPAIVVTTLLTSGAILICGEIVPKAYGLGNAQTWSLRTARPVRLVEIVLAPLIWVFDGVTRRINDWISATSAIERAYVD